MPKWIEKIPVDSETSDTTYVVGISAEGEYGCSCPNYKFRRAQCKHIQSVKATRMTASAYVAKDANDRAKAKETLRRIPVAAKGSIPSPDFTARPRRMIQLEDD